MEKYLRDTLSAARWKEVERIENTEIILPIVRIKRNRLDSLRKEKMRRLQLKATAKHPEPNNPSKKTVVVHYHLSAIKPDNEEQFI
jgi:hypothetical protein